MIDRFGLLPDALKNLLRVTSIKQRAQQLGIRKIEAGAVSGKIEFEQQPNIEPIALVKLVQSKPATYKLAGASALSFKAELSDNAQRFTFIEQLLDTLTPASSARRSA
jgi:transcription-repair coupling factor (superfamily II helicase)